VSRYYWGVLDTRSYYSESRLLSEYGGRHYEVRAFGFERGVKEHATYTGHRQLRLTLEAEDGTEVLVRTGSIAEIDGRFKFLSYVRD
jgi:hypothetical protein